MGGFSFESRILDFESFLHSPIPNLRAPVNPYPSPLHLKTIDEGGNGVG